MKFGDPSIGWFLAIVLAVLSRPETSLAQETDSTTVDSTLIKEIERELGMTDESPTPTSSLQRGQTTRSGMTTNPDISVIGDFGAWYLSDADRNFDFTMNEVETSFKGAVDPYARADVYISIANEDDEFVFELEEAFLTTLSLPYKLQAKVGRFRNNFGKINRIHPHALPYPDTPLLNEYYLGDEGLKDEGFSANWLLPNKTFFQELTFEFTRGPSESPSFERSEKNRFLYVGHLKNFWDLTPNATLELGFSGAAGPNDVGRTTILGGVDLTYRWKPLRRNTYRSFAFQFEGLVSRRDAALGSDVTSFALYAMMQYQLAQRWHVVGRFDHSDLPDDNGWNENAVSLFLGWYATEFQKLELGLRTRSGSRFDRNWEVLARLIFVIGTHGAHEY